MKGLIGRKAGMTRIFNKESGDTIPVSVIAVGANTVVQIKTKDVDGYQAAQLGFDIISEKRSNKPKLGHFKKHNSAPVRILREFKLDAETEQLESGQKVGVEIFEDVQFVDVIGTSKGRGHAGTIKKYHFQRGRETHGNTNHRERGSSGANTYPARVLPGLPMSGQYGNQQRTVRNLKLVGMDKEAGLLFIRGAIPGFTRSIVFVSKNPMKKAVQVKKAPKTK